MTWRVHPASSEWRPSWLGLLQDGRDLSNRDSSQAYMPVVSLESTEVSQGSSSSNKQIFHNSILVMMVWFFKNKMGKQLIISTDAEKGFAKTQHSLIIIKSLITS
jgi:hypothetical protein